MAPTTVSSQPPLATITSGTSVMLERKEGRGRRKSQWASRTFSQLPTSRGTTLASLSLAGSDSCQYNVTACNNVTASFRKFLKSYF